MKFQLYINNITRISESQSQQPTFIPVSMRLSLKARVKKPRVLCKKVQKVQRSNDFYIDEAHMVFVTFRFVVFLSSANEVSTGPTCQFLSVCLFVCLSQILDMKQNAIGRPLVRGPHLSFPFWRPLVRAGPPCGPLSRSGLTR